METTEITPRQCAVLIVVVFLMFAIPVAITLSRADVARPLMTIAPDISPLGYTFSLLIFIIPASVIAFWLIPREHLHVPRRAFWWTIAILFPLGAGLDFFFAHWFFVFPNAAATLGIHAPAMGGWVPIEEYIFYLTGFLAVVLVYIWCDEYWLAAYHVHVVPPTKPLFQFHWPSLLAGIALLVAGVVYKYVFSPYPEGFPGYFTFLVCLVFIPSSFFFGTALPYINWRAFSVTMAMMMLVSLLWEATLGVPYGWWGYNVNAMLGILIRGWSNLPLEAALVWVSLTYTTSIAFTIIKLWLASGKSLWGALFGDQRGR